MVGGGSWTNASGVEECHRAAVSGSDCVFAVRRATLTGATTRAISTGVISASGDAETCVNARSSAPGVVEEALRPGQRAAVG